MTRIRILLILLPFTVLAQVQLRPWVQVYGNVNGQQLGKYVTGITPGANLPYKAAVSQIGSTGIYRLQTANDTATQKIFFGENLLTGDLNNDGHTDVVMTKRQESSSTDTVLVFWGTATGIDTLNPLLIPSKESNDDLRAVAIADVNNDGYLDLITSALNFGLDNGKVSFHFGPTISSTPDAAIIGDTVRSRLGLAVDVGDINNDGWKDLIIRGSKQIGSSTERYDYIRMYWGVGPDTLDLTYDLELRGFDLYSSGLACFDVNGDGVDDLLWTNRDSVAGGVFINYGGSTFDSIPSLRLRNPGVASIGDVIANGGDMNRDGYNDVKVGASTATITNGYVFVFGAGPQIDENYDAYATMSTNARFGASLSSVGDVNGDGLADFIVGAPEYPFGNNRGYWGIFLGDSTMRVTDVKETTSLPQVAQLYQCYPNPFNPVTMIPFELATRGHVLLKVYDVTGREVATLVNDQRAAGRYEATFNARNLSSGVYFYRLTIQSSDGHKFTETKKMILLSELKKNEQEEFIKGLFIRARARDAQARLELERINDEQTPEWLRDGRGKSASPPTTALRRGM